ncbi:hemerythrin domain-containing protein [Nocardioides marmoribigeumensis]|uniref:Hemerythrin-like domain-containing protein n=1 Tax=Nocardioides marmoribigeumensis TaxID=433649 RepID=A0ABU2BWD0_9ACTN|nr:hemerythrin domain-containing protein [Nocardioides marmoribigeumensis]MDR7361654.1 hypothetical protein [Nocardioides marmoribigeumensis]
MSTTTPVPQLRLPGQAAAPEGPVDMAMMYVAHHAFRRDLRDFARAVPLTPVTDRAAWRALERRWAVFADVLHHHHSGEDAHLWPALLDRAQGEDRATVEAMEDEHAGVDPLLEACRDGLTAMVAAPSADTRSALTVRLVALREALGRHLDHEETETIALVQRLLSAAEYDAIDEHFKKTLTPRRLFRLVPWALVEVPTEVREELLGREGGTAHRVAWVVSRGSFRRLQRAAFAHLPG